MAEGIFQHLEELQNSYLTGYTAEDRPFEELLSVTVEHELTDELAQDDLKRETAFYEATQEGVFEALQKCDELNIKHRRPRDYYAEMVKTDAHMKRIKERLLTDKQRIEDAEERRRNREMKKFGKQAQVAKQQERAKLKKQDMDLVKKLRKNKGMGMNGEDLDDMLDFDDDKKGGKGQGFRKGDKDGKQRNRKRESKDKKYGFGGRKAPMKKNDAKSSADMSGFNPHKNKQVPSSLAHKANKTIQKKRPGKTMRHKQNLKR